MDNLNKALFNADGTGEIADNNQARRAAIGEDQAKGILIMGSDGTNAIPFAVDSNGNLSIALTTGDINVDTTSGDLGAYVGKAAGTNADFAVAYTAATQITCSSFPTGLSAINDEDILVIVQITSAGVVSNIYTRNDATISVAANVITVSGATFAASDTFVVYTNIPRALEIDEVIGTDDATAPTKSLQVGGKYEMALSEIDNGDSAALAIDAFRRLIIAAYNASKGAIDVSQVDPAETMRYKVTGITQLTAAGSTTEFNVESYHNGCFSYTVASIDTSVTVRAEGTIDGTNWFNLGSGDTTHTANGTYRLDFSARAISKVRFTFVSEVGGAACTIDPDFMAGN